MGEFLGKALMARDFCAYVEPHWPNQRIKAVATALSESRIRIGAYNINYKNGVKDSMDCGVMQINIPAALIGTSVERKLRTESLDKAEWEPVLKYNVLRAYQLWSIKDYYRDGHLDYRRWRPWFGYTDGWAIHPRVFVYHQTLDHEPVGPWVLTGQYLFKAIRGVANYDLLQNRTNPEQAVSWAEFQSTSFGAKPGWVTWHYDPTKLVYYTHEEQPTHIPTEADNWGYPVKNNGR